MVAATNPDLTDVDYWAALIKKSTSRYFLLDMLATRPMHGYEIAKSIEECCNGWCKPTDGMIYPTLKEMVAGGYVDCTSEVVGGRERKVCSLTDKGKEAHRAAAAAWNGVLPYLSKSAEAAACC